MGRCLMSLGLMVVLALTPSFGPNRLWIAGAIAVGIVAQGGWLSRVLRRTGALPVICPVSDHVIIATAGALAPQTFTWGMVVAAVNLPLSVIAYGQAFAYRLVLCSTPVFVAIGAWHRPEDWTIGLAIFCIGGFGSCFLAGYATEEERRIRDRYSDILDQLQVVVYEAPDVDQPLTYINDAVRNMIGFTREQWVDPDWWRSRLHPDDRADWDRSAIRSAPGATHQQNYRLLAEDGRVVHILEITRVVDAGAGRTRIRGVLVDVTRERQAEDQASQLSLFVDQIPLALQILEIADPDDLDGIRMIAANRVACDNVDATLDQLISEWPQRYSVVDSQPGNMEAFASVRRSGAPLTNHERDWVDPSGAARRVNIEAFPLGGDYVGVSYEDITDRANAEQRLRHQANHDALTGLPSRAYLADRLEAALQRAADEEGRTGALLIMDLNQFKEVNDALGHHHGDRLLVELSGRLDEIAGDSHVIARLGGDEFAMIVEDGTARQALEIAADIGRRFAEPTVIDGVRLQTNVSVGIALYPEHATDADGLMQRADTAMYRAKTGGTGVSLFTPEQSSTGMRRLQLLSDLRTAVEHNELTLHYQPQLDLQTGDVAGLEALVRWHHPTFGMLPPDEFIGLAEVSGFIQDLTQFVIRAAAADNARLVAAGFHLPVAVNLSVRNLYSPDLVDGIMRSLDTHQLPPELLRVELTETEIMDDPAIAMQVLQRLRSLGIEVCIDDFGTGYSSLSYLRDLAIDEIKIDRSFVADISDGDDVVVRSIIDLGHALGVRVTGEGVETEGQWNHLQRLGCDIAQGYLMSRPLPFEALMHFLTDREEFATAFGARDRPIDAADVQAPATTAATLGPKVTPG